MYIGRCEQESASYRVEFGPAHGILTKVVHKTIAVRSLTDLRENWYFTTHGFVRMERFFTFCVVF